jgi:heme A synthase
MARRLLIAGGGAIASYVVGGFLGGWLVSVLSSNTHDVSVKAAMTEAFVIGPHAGLIAFLAGFLVSRRRTPSAARNPR